MGEENSLALLLTLPAPDPYKCGLFLGEDAAERRLGTGEGAASAGQVLTVMALLCLTPVYDQPCLSCFVFFFSSSSGVCPLQLHPMCVLFR